MGSKAKVRKLSSTSEDPEVQELIKATTNKLSSLYTKATDSQTILPRYC